jgi:hypothetical protein
MHTTVAIRATAGEGSTLHYVTGIRTSNDSLELVFGVRRGSDERR